MSPFLLLYPDVLLVSAVFEPDDLASAVELATVAVVADDFLASLFPVFPPQEVRTNVEANKIASDFFISPPCYITAVISVTFV